MISEELQGELNEILEEDFGEKVTKKETSEIAENLISVYDLFLKITGTINGETIEGTIKGNITTEEIDD